MSTLHKLALLLLALLCGVAATDRTSTADPVGTFAPRLKPQSYEELTGSKFLPPLGNPFQPPDTREAVMPSFTAAQSVWGATGRDVRGRIWVGVSAGGTETSAHLYRYAPDANAWKDCGAVVDQLRLAGLHRKGEGQNKIHSKIIPAGDGWLYFASTDEEGEKDDGSALPRWGGHLWRVDPDSCRWQHLKAVPEGLVAASGVGRYIYALGYWGHVLYQYDTSSGSTTRVVVGSVGGHVSRNFLADVNGHAYVPRIIRAANGRLAAMLVEYDHQLREIAATPLSFYFGKTGVNSNHGIVGIVYLPDGRLLFSTHFGRLYVIEANVGKPASVTDIGWFHPDGNAYTPSLFVLGGSNLLAGVARRQYKYEWVVFDVQARLARAFPFAVHGLKNVLIYGSITRDNTGNFYVGGWARGEDRRLRPLLMQVSVGN